MSESTEPEEAIHVEQDGVSLTKSLLLEEFPVPTVGFELTSNREEAVDIVVRDYVPEDFTMDAIGFHAEYESENWTAFQDNRIEYERTIGPEETVITIYGLRIESVDDAQAFMDEPELAAVEPGLEDEAAAAAAAAAEVADRGRGDALREVIEETEQGDQGGATDGAADVSDAEPAIEASPDDAVIVEDTPDEGDETTPEVDDDTPADTAPEPPSGIDAVAATLADELRADEVDEADRELITDELGLALSGSTEARLEHLQARIEELHAYSEPITAFLDDGGPARMDDLDADLTAVQDRLDDLDATLADVEAATDDLREDLTERLDAHETDLEGLEADLDDRLDEHERRLDESLDDLTDRLEGDERDLRSLRHDLQEIEEWRDQLGEMFGSADE